VRERGEKEAECKAPIFMVTGLMALMVATNALLLPTGTQPIHLSTVACRTALPPSCMARLPKAFRGGGRDELWEGAEWDGRVAEITNFGCFVQLTKQGVVRHRGLVHISTLVSDRMEQDLVKEYIESKVGPIGSKVRVRVDSLEFKGQRRVALKLLDVLDKQSAEEIAARAVAPGPRHLDIEVDEDEITRHLDINIDEDEM